MKGEEERVKEKMGNLLRALLSSPSFPENPFGEGEFEGEAPDRV